MISDMSATILPGQPVAGTLFLADGQGDPGLYLMTDRQSEPKVLLLANKSGSLSAPMLVNSSKAGKQFYQVPDGLVVRGGHDARDFFPPARQSIFQASLFTDGGKMFVADTKSDIFVVDLSSGATVDSIAGFPQDTGLKNWSIQWVQEGKPDVVLAKY